jgi:hypothetical protein
MNIMDSKMGDLLYTFRNLIDAINDRYDLFEKDEEMLDILDEAQKSLDKYAGLDEDEAE